jgi:tetratricopeptide (TPR) repeat protein
VFARLVAQFAERRADALHDKGMACSEAGDKDGALANYLRAVELDPARPHTLYNIGLVYKYRQDWPKALDYNRRAFDLRPDDEATCWNLGIAATALGDWATARRAWLQCGYDIGEGDGPIDADFGRACVRLNPDEDAEVVWVRRIDPVRARILNVPLPASGFFYGDVVLHDGAAMGAKVSGEREHPIFNAFQRLARSEYATAVVALEAPSEADVERLADAGDEVRLAVEDWTTVSYLCKACSEGVTPAEHEHEPVWNTDREAGIAFHDEDALHRVLSAWAEGGPGRYVEIVEVIR